MLIENHANTLPLSGKLQLSITFENGIPSVDSWKFEQTSKPSMPDKLPSRGIFESRLLAVVEGLDHFTSAIDAMAQDFRSLAGDFPEEFFMALQPKLAGRERRHLARKRADVYPRSDLALENSIKLVEGWYFGTNISNREKVKFLKIACRLRNVQPTPMQARRGGC